MLTPATMSIPVFWEPVRLVDVTTRPFCFPNLGGVRLDPGFNIGHGYAASSSQVGGQGQNTAKYHVHYYIYPLLYWLELLTDFVCFEQSSFDIVYLSEIDPLWQDDQLTTLLNPEAAIFANPLAQAACAADCVAASASLPLDELFWCSGCQGPMYPMNGNIGANIGIKQSARLAAERMVYKMHRMGRGGCRFDAIIGACQLRSVLLLGQFGPRTSFALLAKD